MNRTPSRLIALSLSLSLFAQPAWPISTPVRANCSSLSTRITSETVVPWMFWVGQRLEISAKAPFWARRLGAKWARKTYVAPPESRLEALEIAEALPLTDAAGALIPLDTLRKEYTQRLVPREVSKPTDTVIRQSVFRHINGLVLIPTLLALSTPPSPKSPQSVLRFIDARPGVTLQMISETFNPENPDANMGYKYTFLRTLALQGWVTLEGQDEQTRFSLTPLGKKVLELAERHRYVLEHANSAYRYTHRFYELFRKTTLSPEDRQGLDFYRGLIAQSEQNWIPDGMAGDLLGQQAVQELRASLEGTLMAPTLVALAIQTEQISPLYPPGSSEIRTPPLSSPLNQPFVQEALGYLSVQEPFGKPLGYFQDNVFTLSEDGKDFLRRSGSYGVPTSYLKAYQAPYVRGMLFDSKNPDPARIGTYQHFDPVINGWGTAATHTTYLPHLIVEVLQMLETGAQGVAELGAGSGKLVASLAAASLGWKRVLSRYHSALHGPSEIMIAGESERPFFAIGSDVTLTARIATWYRLARQFSRRPEVIFRSLYGDITNPSAFARVMNAVVGVPASAIVLLLMFVIEERHLDKMDRDGADRVFLNSVTRMLRQPGGQEELTEQLRRMGALLPAEPLPTGDELVNLVKRQFNISKSNLGRLVPAVVAGAELVHSMERFAEVQPFGILALDVCTTGIDQLDWRPGVQPDVNYYGTHLLREKIDTEDQRALAYMLAGFRFAARKSIPDKGKGPGGRGVPLVGFSRLSRDTLSLLPSGGDVRTHPEKPRSYAIRAPDVSTQRVRHEAKVVAELLGAAFAIDPAQTAQVIAETQVEFFYSPAQSNAGHKRIQIHRLEGVYDSLTARSFLSALASEMGHRFHQELLESQWDPPSGISSAVAEAYDAAARAALMNTLNPSWAAMEMSYLKRTAALGGILVQAIKKYGITVEEFLGGDTEMGRSVLLEAGKIILGLNPQLSIGALHERLTEIASDFFWIPPAGAPILPFPAAHLIGNWIFWGLTSHFYGNWRDAMRIMGSALNYSPIRFRTVVDFRNTLELTIAHPSHTFDFAFHQDQWELSRGKLLAFVVGVHRHPIILPKTEVSGSQSSGLSPRELLNQLALMMANEATRALFPHTTITASVIEGWGTFTEMDVAPRRNRSRKPPKGQQSTPSILRAA